MKIFVTIYECFKFAIKSITSSKLRSILTVLGIVIGISSVTMIDALGSGIKSDLTDSLSSVGADTLTIYSTDSDFTIKNDDMDLLNLHDNVKFIIPIISTSSEYTDVKTDEKEMVNISGITPENNVVTPKTVADGRFITEVDVEREANFVVVSEKFGREYFGTKDCLGQIVELVIYDSPQQFYVVGVLESDANSDMFSGGEEVFVPYTALQKIHSSNNEKLDGLVVALKDEGDEAVSRSITEFKTMLTVKNSAEKDTYTVYDMSKGMESITEAFGMVILFIQFVAGIALIVGSIGVMNIMLVTVTERTREIGVRKALGATKATIRIQFIIEAVSLSILGGAIGTALGFISANIAGKYMKITPSMSISTIIMVVLVSTVIGVISGLYPAIKASNLNPIDALRYE
ncbi:MAG: ABC transporter permease [Lachnospirales bacterium]